LDFSTSYKKGYTYLVNQFLVILNYGNNAMIVVK
jgi:hypothetical protein